VASLVKLLALVVVAGGVGVVLGMGLSRLSGGDDPTPVADPTASAGRAGSATTTAAPTSTGATTAATAIAKTTTTGTTPATSTTASKPAKRLAQVRVSVLDARLFTDETPSGRQEQRARMTVRVRAENAGGWTVTLEQPTLGVGSARVVPDPDADAPGATFEPLAAGEMQTVTLRFALAGEATPKVVRDRRARIFVSGRSVPMGVKVGAPTP